MEAGQETRVSAHWACIAGCMGSWKYGKQNFCAELTWKGGGVETAGITAAAAAAAAAAALAGSCWTAMGLMMCSTVWILPSSIILAGGAA